MWNRYLKSNNILLIFLVIIGTLYISDHVELMKLKNKSEATKNKFKNINHKERLEQRNKRLKEKCKILYDPTRVEYSSLYQKRVKDNVCTGTYFKVDDKHHFICNVLKAGSTSWEMFFAENKINSTFIAYCQDKGCPTQTEMKIIQVRHPFERLVSSYRHIFKNGGWKTLDSFWSDDKKLEESYKNIFSKSFQQFVDEILVRNQFYISEDHFDDHDWPGVWLKTHWSPYWFTCGVCASDQAPDYIVKLETLQWDIPEIMKTLGLPDNIHFPDVRVTGSDDNFDEGNRGSDEFVGKYFSQLTKTQVIDLYRIFRVDFELFDYSPDMYYELARD